MEDKFSKAGELGTEHGKHAASSAFDGNTGPDFYRWALKGIEDGDPAVLESFREPSLSGEYMDGYSEQDLLSELEAEGETPDTQDELADEYLQAARDAFWAEVERAARYQVGDA
jgi:hypothetical protein